MPRLFFASSLHFLASSLLVGGLVGLASSALDTWRLARRGAVRPLTSSPGSWALYLVGQIAAGIVAAALVIGFAAFIREGVAAAPADILHFGLRPWDSTRLALLTGVVVMNVAVVTLGVMCYRSALLPWAMGSLRPSGRLVTAAAWMAGPLLLIGTGWPSRRRRGGRRSWRLPSSRQSRGASAGFAPTSAKPHRRPAFWP